MLEIIIIIAVVKAFSATAESKGRSKIAWGFLGALSYYGPILLMSFLLLPLMVQLGMLPFITQDNYFFVSILTNLAAGILCCLVTYQILKGLPGTTETNTTIAGHGEHGPIDSDDSNPYRSNF